MGKVHCTKLAAWPPEKEAPARLHAFGLSLRVFGGPCREKSCSFVLQGCALYSS